MWFLVFITALFAQGKSIDKKSMKKTRKVLTPSQSLKLAQQEALQGNNKKVIDILRPILYPTSKFPNEEEEVKALRLLGLSFYYKGDKTDSEQAFTVLLNRKPSFKLDPVVVPSGAISFFNSIRKKLKDKLIEIRKLKLEEEKKKKALLEAIRKKKLLELRKNAPILEKTMVINKNYMLFNFFPGGLGQFQNEDPVKGWIFASVQTFFGLISIGSYSYLSYKYPKGVVPSSEVNSARQIQYLQVGSGVAFTTLWIISVIDAFLNFKPSREFVKKRYIPSKNKLRFFGAPVDGGAIFGLSGEF
jgi:hypothetical protein